MLDLNGKRIMVLAAHPDDESLGCGGTMAKLKGQGCTVNVLSFTDGVSARDPKAASRSNQFEKACKSLGVDEYHCLNMPDNELDKVSNLEITKIIEEKAETFKPEIVFVHFCSDLNVDHQKVFAAAITAFRPVPGQSVKCILQYEVVSSTEWDGSNGRAFNPNVFIDIGGFIDAKMKALAYYEDEMRPHPHARSTTNIKNVASVRGASVGVEYAEAFELFRCVTI